MDATEVEEYSKFYLDAIPKLVTFLLCAGISFADAADCAQETLIDALPPVWATLTHPYAWCRLVAHRKSCALRTRRRESPLASLEGAGAPLIAPGTEFDELEQRLELMRVLAQLGSEKQRSVLAWTYDGASPKEIADALQMEQATVRSTLRNGREALRRLREQERPT